MQFLVKRAQKGDADAFVALIEANKESMYRVAKGFFASEEDAADAVADAVLSAFEHIAELRKAAYFKTWLIRILINSCNQIVRERKRVTSMEEIPEYGDLSPEYAMVEFREMLNSLPKDSQTIMLLYYGEGMTIREIADVLSMNENTVKSKLRRARNDLQHSIAVV